MDRRIEDEFVKTLGVFDEIANCVLEIDEEKLKQAQEMLEKEKQELKDAFPGLSMPATTEDEPINLKISGLLQGKPEQEGQKSGVHTQKNSNEELPVVVVTPKSRVSTNRRKSRSTARKSLGGLGKTNLLPEVIKSLRSKIKVSLESMKAEVEKQRLMQESLTPSFNIFKNQPEQKPSDES